MSSLAHSSSSAAEPKHAISQLPKYLHHRGKSFYFKRRIPADVVEGFPQFTGQVWKSLDTDSLSTARVFLSVELTEFELTVANLRRSKALESAKSVSAKEIKPLLSITRRVTRPPILSEVGSALEAFQPKSLPKKGCAVGSATTAPTLTGVLVTPAIPLASSSAKGKKIAVSAKRQATTVGSQNFGGNLILPTMSHLFESWKRNQTRQRSVNAVHTAVMEFRTLHGLLPVEQIEKKHARAYRDHLIDRQLSKRTVEGRLGFLSTLMRHGMRELVDHLHFNPFEHIDVSGAQGIRIPKDRRAYSVSELNQIFASRLYTQGYRPDGQAADASYWVPILGPFLGARIEELCQLRVEDVHRVNGVWCVRICDLDEDQKVKTSSSFRRVPLHDAVIRSGFLVYVAKMATAGHERVFPTLTNDNANSIYSNSVGKWYGRYLESIGLSDHRLDFHSFRYSFRQQCSLCGIENEVRDALTGHWVSKNDAGRTYMKGENRQYPFPKLAFAIGQLRYEEMKIAHIYVDEPMNGVEAALLK